MSTVSGAQQIQAFCHCFCFLLWCKHPQPGECLSPIPVCGYTQGEFVSTVVRGLLAPTPAARGKGWRPVEGEQSEAKGGWEGKIHTHLRPAGRQNSSLAGEMDHCIPLSSHELSVCLWEMVFVVPADNGTNRQPSSRQLLRSAAHTAGAAPSKSSHHERSQHKELLGHISQESLLRDFQLHNPCTAAKMLTCLHNMPPAGLIISWLHPHEVLPT